ncbi:MAG: PHP domain-containing protein, partial [Crocinitomicaceae bacterium]
MFLIFDTETTGLPRNYNAPISDTDNWPRVVQIAWQLHDELGNVLEHKDFLIRPNGFNIPYESEKVHGISTELANLGGEELEDVLFLFKKALKKASFIVGHNVSFDNNVLGCEFFRLGEDSPLTLPVLDTCTEDTAELLKLPGGRGGKFKLPTLTELHSYLFQTPFEEAHNATADVEATTRCFLELIRREQFSLEQLIQQSGYFESFKQTNPSIIQPIGLKHINLKAESEKLREASKPKQEPSKISVPSEETDLGNVTFAHLHNHSQYSILQSTAEVQKLVQKAIDLNMPAVALTDTGNMMAAFHFEKAASAYNDKVKEERKQAEEAGEPFSKKEILPIIGCEFNVCRNLEDKSQKDNGYQVVFLAKNKEGYQNLIKLASIAYTKGMYYVPRIDKEAIKKYKENLIVLSGNLYGEIPNLILNVGLNQAEEALLWWKEQFGEDFYLEVNRHGLEVEDRV